MMDNPLNWPLYLGPIHLPATTYHRVTQETGAIVAKLLEEHFAKLRWVEHDVVCGDITVEEADDKAERLFDEFEQQLRELDRSVDA